MSWDATDSTGKENVIRQYSRQAPLYARSATMGDQEALARVVEAARLEPTDRVLDVATGAGFTAFACAPYCLSVVGADLTLPMLREAQQGLATRAVGNLHLVASDAERLAFRATTFEVTVCRFAGHHFSSVSAFLHEARRVTRPGGRVVVDDSCSIDGDAACNTWLHQVECLRDPSHVWNLSAGQWRQAFAHAGLVVEQVEPAAPIQLEFTDWVERGGCDDGTVGRLRELFRTAPPSARKHFGIEVRGGKTYFHWRRVILRGRVPD